MNGGQLADAARKKRHRLKVLFTTGYARDVIVHDGRVDPGVQLITKPFSYPALAGKLRDVLDAPADPGRILVVEDEVLIQMLLNEYLEELGFKAEIVASAADAKSKLHSLSGEIDAAIVDVGLPDMRGDALVSELRSVYLPLSLRVDTMRSHCKGNSWGRNASAFCVSHTTQSNCVLPFPRLAFFLKGRHDGLLRPC
jgi:CheY-like chemotaxis protein